ncbi:MAG TPA: hypothetical protein VGE66_03530 [Chitinophagaceae bacterium]
MQEHASTHSGINSLVSVNPLVTVIRKMIAEGSPGARKLYENLLKEVEAVPELLEAHGDAVPLLKHAELVETLLSTIFTPSTAAHQGMYAISFPFRSETIYASQAFKDQFLKEDDNNISVPDNKTNYTIAKASIYLAYNLIMRKFYGWDTPKVASSVHYFPDPESGLNRYLELTLNAQFVSVKKISDDFEMPNTYTVQRAIDMEELRKVFPIEHFQFEGLVVIDVADVTAEQVITEIKNTLIDINAFSDVTVYDKLQAHIQTFLGLKDVSVGITPFFRINEYYLFSDLHYRNSILFRNGQVLAYRHGTSEKAQRIFRDTDQPVLYQNLTDQSGNGNELLPYYRELGARSLILCPLKCEDGQLIGLLEIMSEEPARLSYHHVRKIQSAMQLFTFALEKSVETLELQIDKTIKEHFTAIQPAVEWKFTEAAFNYLQHRQENEMARIPNIAFNDVYPLYGAIDIRNSSLERNNAIQLDLLEQLNLAHKVLEVATFKMEFPLLQEIKFKIDKYINAATETLLSDDELMIYDFLQNHIEVLFRHLSITRPEMKRIIDEYFAALDPQKNLVYDHRKKYEESITKINDTLDRFIDREQATIQKIYPHYFERYITDGVEFNIYIGQSMAPNLPFSEIYVSNLKMWQLSLLVKAARVAYQLEKKLDLPMKTTQLILAHCIPLSISFRRKERKFDVDGAYNIRYEIVKKRIDKVHIRDGERLTCPGHIAIVYSQHKELQEYLEYIEFLASEGMLEGEVEHHELEELQGISGLKAIRVKINLEGKNEATPEAMAKVAQKQVMRR